MDGLEVTTKTPLSYYTNMVDLQILGMNSELTIYTRIYYIIMTEK